MHTPEQVDVLIVGAGLAGCSLGLLMRRAGRSVLIAELLDARTKDKLCGGALTSDGPELFGLIYGEDALSRLGAVELDGIDAILLDKHLRMPFTAMSLPRKRLDDFCLDAYLSAGGVLADRLALRSIDVQEHAVRLFDLRTREMHDVRYGTLVGADGAGSKVRRLITGSIGPACTSVEGRVALREEHVVTSFLPARNGLFWYIPNGDDANVGCAFHGMGAIYCRKKLRDFCAKLGFEPAKVRGALIPTAEDVLLEAAEDIWLVGDAAGLADKFNGSGMHYALESALSLAEELLGRGSYEDAMAPSVRRLAHTAANANKDYFNSVMHIALAGSPRSQS